LGSLLRLVVVKFDCGGMVAASAGAGAILCDTYVPGNWLAFRIFVTQDLFGDFSFLGM
jgi:hypothetical protein